MSFTEGRVHLAVDGEVEDGVEASGAGQCNTEVATHDGHADWVHAVSVDDAGNAILGTQTARCGAPGCAARFGEKNGLRHGFRSLIQVEISGDAQSARRVQQARNAIARFSHPLARSPTPLSLLHVRPHRVAVRRDLKNVVGSVARRDNTFLHISGRIVPVEFGPDLYGLRASVSDAQLSFSGHGCGPLEAGARDLAAGAGGTGRRGRGGAARRGFRRRRCR